MIKTWSHSRLVEFESCAYRSKLKIVDKIPEPERPLPPGKTEHAHDRGTRIHEACELYVRGQGPLPAEAEKFRDEFEALSRLFAGGKVSLEGEWGFDRNWAPCDYYGKEVWTRIKCDAVVFLSRTRAVVIDYKTGKRYGNEIKHGEQTQLYALGLSIKVPELTTIDTELWYLDLDDLHHDQKDTQAWARHRKSWEARGHRMTSAKAFPPNPNKYSCQYCPYKDGICEYAYKPGR